MGAFINIRREKSLLEQRSEPCIYFLCQHPIQDLALGLDGVMTTLSYKARIRRPSTDYIFGRQILLRPDHERRLIVDCWWNVQYIFNDMFHEPVTV